MSSNVEIYFSHCPNERHYVVLPLASFQHSPVPLTLDLDACPRCGTPVHLVGFLLGFVSEANRDLGWNSDKTAT
jgi:hypothetical protein